MLASELVYLVLGPLFGDRVGPHPLPESFDKSSTYLTYQGISNVALTTVKGWTGHDLVRMQVNVYNHDNIQCEKDAIKTKWAMTEQKLLSCEVIGSGSSGFDEETQLNFQQIDFYIWQTACN